MSANMVSKKPTRQGSRILELDALRGLAALAVVLFHFTTRYDELFSHREMLLARFPWGHYGVDLFFMLSGFVILMTLDRESDPWKFAWGRFTRLFPTYWVAVLITFTVVYSVGLPGQEVSLGAALINLSMVQSILDWPHVDGAYWSLQAELIFYVNMLVCYRLGMFRRPQLTLVIWISLAGIAQVLISLFENSLPQMASLANKISTLTSLKFIPWFAVGMVLYGVHRRLKITRADLACLLACWAFIWLSNGFTPAATTCLLTVLLFLAVEGQLPLLKSKVLLGLGALSYPLYLIHQNNGYVLIRWLESKGVSPEWAIGGAIILACLAAGVLHQFVEKPALAFLRRKQRSAQRSSVCPRGPAWPELALEPYKSPDPH